MGYSVKQLKDFQHYFKDKNCDTELICLNDAIERKGEEAYLLVIRKGIDIIVDSNKLMEEQKTIKYDSKFLHYGKVCNKKARHNICFADFSQNADYEKGKGTIIDFKDLPLLSKVRKEILEFTGDTLFAEGNHYYDVKTCYISLHGDSERSKVLGCRLGADFPLYFQWHQNKKPVGKRIKIDLHHGDIYIMSHKAVGNDWKKYKDNLYTLKHAACVNEKYIN